MALLTQATTAIADTRKLTYSAWVNVSSSGSPSTVNLFSFGDALTNWSDINLLNVNNSSALIGVDIIGPSISPAGELAHFNYTSLAAGTGDHNTNFDEATRSATLGSAFGYDVWRHVFVAIDLDETDTIDFNPFAELTARGRKIDVAYGGTVITAGQYGLTIPDSMISGSTPGNVPNWDIAVAGQEISIPDLADNIGASTPAVRFADVQVWFGKYIEPTVGNLAKFIDANGKPVSPAAARAEFGQQTLLFQGDAEGFPVNQGTGGEFTTSGTISDFDTGPSV